MSFDAKNKTIDTPNLINEYNDIMSKPEYWFYYLKNKNQAEEDDQSLVWAQKKDAWITRAGELIKSYFGNGAKGPLFDTFLTNYPTRPCHVFSAFLLGIKLYKDSPLIKKNINAMTKSIEDKLLPKKQEKSPTQRFLYLWFLICLFHDMGYGYEKENFSKDSPIWENIDFNLFNEDIAVPCVGFIPCVLRRNAALYSKKSIDCGEIFRGGNCVDHGIVGGVFLYEKIKDIFNELKNDKSCKKLAKTPAGLIFGDPILNNHIACAAWTIICHNIWVHKRGTCEAKKYEEIGLNELIHNKTDKRFIQLKEHPLLFLLCLVDTIEPVKELERNETMPAEAIKKCLETTSVSIKGGDKHVIIDIKSHPKKELSLDFLLKDHDFKDEAGNFTIKIQKDL